MTLLTHETVLILFVFVYYQSKNSSPFPRPPQGGAPRYRTNTPHRSPVLHTISKLDVHLVGIMRVPTLLTNM